jgi:hypothetical protein
MDDGELWHMGRISGRGRKAISAEAYRANVSVFGRLDGLLRSRGARSL